MQGRGGIEKGTGRLKTLREWIKGKILEVESRRRGKIQRPPSYKDKSARKGIRRLTGEKNN